MKILFDQGTPVPLRRHLHPYSVDTAAEKGWARFENGKLIQKAEDEKYDALITTDQNIRYQQNLTDRKIRILVLKTTSWPRIQVKSLEIRRILDEMGQGSYLEVDF